MMCIILSAVLTLVCYVHQTKRRPCHRYETDDSLNAGWDGPPSWNVSAAAMTGDIELLCTAFEVESRAMRIINLRIIDEIHAHQG